MDRQKIDLFHDCISRILIFSVSSHILQNKKIVIAKLRNYRVMAYKNADGPHPEDGLYKLLGNQVICTQ